MQPVDIFIAYSHHDLAFKNELRVHLRPLVRQGLACVWDDYDIETGHDWEAAIKQKLEGAHIVLLLISPDALDSDYFYGKEVRTALERHDRGEATVVPVVLRACLWHATPLGRLEALPEKGRPVSAWPDRDDVWHSVALKLRELAEARQRQDRDAAERSDQESRFTAAAADAEQYFQDGNWPQARSAFADALALHQPGFEPGTARLQARLAECETQIRAQVENDARERRYQDLLEQARNALQSGRYRRAERLVKEAETLIPGPEVLQLLEAIRQARSLSETQGKKPRDWWEFTAWAAIGAALLFFIGMMVWTNWHDNSRGSLPDTGAASALQSKQQPDFPVPIMVPVPGGTFRMGSTAGDSDARENEKPAHQVTLHDFEIGKYEVTVEQYLAFAEETKANYPEWMEPGSKYNVRTGSEDHYKMLGDALTAKQNPVVGVSWLDAVSYCNWLSRKRGLNPAYRIEGQKVALIPGANGYRLPTEAEWEYAARGGQKNARFKYAGSDQLEEVAWTMGNSGSKTRPVGQKKANALGLYDMSGNVWEWCQDWYAAGYYQNSPEDNPSGPTSGSYRVQRGGSWSDYPQYCRVAVRSYGAPGYRSYNVGFRLARTL